MLTNGLNRFSALRQFEVWTCTRTRARTAPTRGTPSGTRARRMPSRHLAAARVAALSASVRHPGHEGDARRFVVHSTQCTGAPSYQGEQDSIHHADCDTATPARPNFARAPSSRCSGCARSPRLGLRRGQLEADREGAGQRRPDAPVQPRDAHSARSDAEPLHRAAAVRDLGVQQDGVDDLCRGRRLHPRVREPGRLLPGRRSAAGPARADPARVRHPADGRDAPPRVRPDEPVHGWPAVPGRAGQRSVQRH